MTEHVEHSTQTNEHGSIVSYVIGFILSLAFTIVPYYMVTRQITSGTTLLLIILGFAVLQMLVQMFFFLHLGRGPKPLYNIVFFSATAAFIIVVVGASLLIMDNLYRNMSPTEVTMRLAQDENIAEVNGHQTGACQGNNANHIVVLDENTVTPLLVEAERCDTISFKAEDGQDRMLMFGTYENPVSYGGMDDIIVRGDRAKIITLNESGEFSFHDHSNPTTMGQFRVTP